MRGGCRLSQPPEPPAEPVPAIGYIRVSMKREEAISPETQQSAIEDAARRRGFRIIDWVPDLDKTGRNFKRRIMRVIERVEAGEAAAVLVWKYSRFGRDRTGVAVNLARLETAGGELISATEDVDARTATGRFTRGMLLEVAAFESDRIGETWRETLSYRVRQGLPPTGRAHFGYRRLGRIRDEEDPQRTRHEKGVKERYVPDPELGPVLAGMYESYTAGGGGRTIAMGLNGRGILNTRGRPWSGQIVLDVLDSGFGAGYLRLHDPACRCARPEKCRNRVWVRGAHDPVIEEDQWQDYRLRRAGAAQAHPRHLTPVYPLSGLVRCGHCGAAMAGVRMSSARKGRILVYFRCGRQRHYRTCPGNPSVSLRVLMEEVRAVLAALAADIDAAAAVTQARTETVTAARGDAEKLARELAAADRAMARLAVQRAEDEDGMLSGSAWGQAAAELKRKRALLEYQLAAATRTVRVASRDPLPALRGVLADWDLLPVADQNRLLRTVIKSITVWRTGQTARDSRGHFLPQPVRIKVIPMWTPGEGDPVDV